jgi:hypothetical protein
MAMVAIVCGISSKEFSERINSSSISNLPTSGGKNLIRLPFKINFRNLLSFPNSGGRVEMMLNEALNSLPAEDEGGCLWEGKPEQLQFSNLGGDIVEAIIRKIQHNNTLRPVIVVATSARGKVEMRKEAR